MLKGMLNWSVRPAVIGLGLVLYQPLGLAADMRTAAISGIERAVEERPAKRLPWSIARLHDILGLGDSVRTGPASRAELTHSDRSLMRLAELTTITLLDQPNRAISLLLGKLWMRITKGTGGMRVHTPVAVATVTGTEFIIEVTEGNEAILTVVEGTVVLTSDKVSGDVTSVDVSGGQTVTVTPGLPLPAPHAIDVTQILNQETVHREFVPAVEIPGAMPVVTTPQSAVETRPPSIPAAIGPAQAALLNPSPLKVELLQLDPRAVKGSPLASPQDVAPVKVRVK